MGLGSNLPFLPGSKPHNTDRRPTPGGWEICQPLTLSIVSPVILKQWRLLLATEGEATNHSTPYYLISLLLKLLNRSTSDLCLAISHQDTVAECPWAPWATIVSCSWFLVSQNRPHLNMAPGCRQIWGATKWLTSAMLACYAGESLSCQSPPLYLRIVRTLGVSYCLWLPVCCY